MKVSPDFKKNDLIPAVIQDFYTMEILMLGYMNKESYEKTLSTKKITFFSRKRQELWTKGESSGSYLHLKDIKVDCDADTILIKAIPEGPVCHTGTATCFAKENRSSNLGFLENTIKERNSGGDTKSYTQELFTKGPKKIAQKVGEEAVELALEATDIDDDAFLNEAADLMYHYLVLLQSKNFQLDDVIQVLRKRHNV